ncbi:L,D-transpeptidase [Kitasatospora camelliae]|uniref:Ig-like domain-containing protein n=1 Tax=Kitasatospora camelliae TaxID=3156397 RepID=A0AAU8JZR6_9ACTN
MKSIRGGLAVGALGGALVLMVAGCSSGGGKTAEGAPAGAPNATAAARPAVSAAVVSIEPANGAADVKPSGALKVSVAGGKLTTVKVTGPDGKEVPGALAADGLSWLPADALSVSSKYQVSAQAADAAGTVATAESGFTTLTPAKEADPHDNIADNETYGVGMIVSLVFNKDVKEKAAVEKGVTFETSDGTVVKGHWFGDRRVDFRPEKYWKPGTKVTVRYRLKGVEISPGVYGGVDRDEPFSIGRSQISTADMATDQMTVERDGQAAETVPVTGGKPGFDTWNGTMVISEKYESTRMTSRGVTTPGSGDEYDIDDVPHAMRLTDSGTFVHGNYWGRGVFGKSNTSHGCVGISDAKGGSDGSRAGTFFHSSLVGDVVTVVNSKSDKVRPDNGLSGWNLDWSAW